MPPARAASGGRDPWRNNGRRWTRCGRDMPPKSAASSLQAMNDVFVQLGRGRIASIVGRYNAMDRDHRRPRVQAAYDMITQGKAKHTAPDAQSGLEQAYARGGSDEFVE